MYVKRWVGLWGGGYGEEQYGLLRPRGKMVDVSSGAHCDTFGQFSGGLCSVGGGVREFTTGDVAQSTPSAPVAATAPRWITASSSGGIAGAAPYKTKQKRLPWQFVCICSLKIAFLHNNLLKLVAFVCSVTR
ncbi:hypothetical protein DMENIID0001_032680 [Sergentomyia squamirostris]